MAERAEGERETAGWRAPAQRPAPVGRRAWSSAATSPRRTAIPSTPSNGSGAAPSSRTRRARSSSSSTTSRSRPSWSQLATNVVVSKYFRGALGSPEREHSVRQMIGRVVRTIRGWGEAQGYFAHAGGRRGVRRRADASAPASAGVVQQPGVVQRRHRAAPAVLGLLHPLGRGHDGVDPRLVPQRGHHLQGRLGLGRQPVADPLLARTARRRRHRLGAGVVHEGGRRVGGRDQVGRQDAPRREDGRC